MHVLFLSHVGAAVAAPVCTETGVDEPHPPTAAHLLRCPWLACAENTTIIDNTNVMVADYPDAGFTMVDDGWDDTYTAW